MVVKATVNSMADSAVKATSNDVRSSDVRSSDVTSSDATYVVRLVRFCLGICENVVAAIFVASALGSLLRADALTIGMCLTYTPRVAWLFVAIGLGLVYLKQQKLRRLSIVVVLAGILCYDATWGGGMQPRGTAETLTLLSFNTHYALGSEVAKLCEQYDVDVLVLQENRPGAGNREAFAAELPSYKFFRSDGGNAECGVHSALTNVTGIRSDLLQEETVRVSGPLTDFRTFGVTAQLKSGPLRVVNVHTIKPFQFARRPRHFVSLLMHLMRRHRVEHDRLVSWLDESGSHRVPTLLAGDFNAPGNGYNLRFEDFKNAQRECGQGLHLTFPAGLPILGIDHVLGNKHIRFQACEILNTGISDHRAMLVTFSIEQALER